MRALALLCVWSLAGCSSVGSPLDWAIPDELTLGQGSSDYAWSGGHMGSDPAYAYAGENESTYAALTWDLPGIEKSDGMSRETQRNMALLIDQMVEDEGLSVAPEPGTKKPVSDTPEPPPWMPYALGGIVAVFALAMLVRSRRSNGW